MCDHALEHLSSYTTARNAPHREKIGIRPRPVTRGDARGAFAPPPQVPKVHILILNIQVRECGRLS